MSAPAVSPRTLVRDAIMRMLESGKGQPHLRVPAYAVSPRFLTEQETSQGNTYCVLITDEQAAAPTMTARNSRITIKLVCYAYHTKDPRAVLDGMIEDIAELLARLAQEASVQGLIRDVQSDSLTTDDATTAAGPWAQAVAIWTARLSRP